MGKRSRLFFLVLLLIFLLHAITLILLLGSKYAAQKKHTQQKKERVILIQKTPEKPLPKKKTKLKKQDLPTMLPGKQTPPTKKTAPNKQTKPEKKTESIKKGASKVKAPKKAPKQTEKKPVFNFNTINQYAFAVGNSAFKNFGTNRPPREDDLALLTYQEKVRRHFGDSFNKYANQTYFYNLDTALINLQFTVDRDGRIINTDTQNYSNNPAITNLIEKILQYAEPFPRMPQKVKLTSFTTGFSIKFESGKLAGYYRWT